MKRSLLIILAILCLILCLGLASCGGNGGTENGGNTEGGGNVEDNKEYVTITFDTKGGSALESVQVEKGGKIPKPQNPERLGYTFDKWYYDGVEWVFVGYVATEDMTLEASWTPITYTIEYIGATGGKSTYTVEDEFDLEGYYEGEDFYMFSGWYLDEELTQPISKIEKGTTGNLKLYGKTEYSGFKLELMDDGYEVVRGDSFARKVVIPETYNGIKITTIGDYAFASCTGLTSVVIPNSITTIGENAFYDCTGLTSIEIPNGVTTIGYSAFYGCTGLTNVEIPNSVTTIGECAFSGCTGLTKVDISDIGAWCKISFGYQESNPLWYAKNLYLNDVLVTDLVIPNDITSISDRAFYGCTSLTSVEIPNSVTTIGENAFYYCTGLTSVVIPNSVTSIGNYAFCYCTSLASITVDEKNQTYKSIDGNLYTKDGKTFVLYAIGKKATSFVIPNNVTTIDHGVFAGCTSLTSVEIPNSVTTISDWAFDRCTELTSVVIPNGVTSIGSFAFYYCTGLTSVVIPNSVTSIGNYAFSDCTSLTSVVIPNSVTSIGSSAFRFCTGLTIYCEAESQPSGWDSEWNPFYCPVYWYSENEPTTSGNYWHYVDGEVTKWE